MGRFRWTVAAVAAAVLVRCAAPQATGQDPQPTFKAATDLVLLQVTVFDRRSNAVEGLPQGAFTVYEEGAPQDIAFFGSGDVPVAVGLVVDNSSSMLARRHMVVAGGRAFADSSRPDDQLFTIVFNEHVRKGLPQTVAFTHSPAQLVASLNRFQAGGKTAVYDAVIAALDHLEQSPLQKKVLVVLSDGGDNASTATREQMLARAAQSDALIYTVAQARSYSADEGDPDVLRKLADVSGGTAYFSASERQTVQFFEDIGGNIRLGYTIGYVPPRPADGSFHRVRVIVREGGRSLRAQVRDGYVASTAAAH